VVGRAFAQRLRPIHIGRRLLREIKLNHPVSADGKSIAPNHFEVRLNAEDRNAFGELEKALVAELIDAAVRYAVDEGYKLVGEVEISLVTDSTMRRGKFSVHSEIRPGSRLTGGASASLGEVDHSSEVSPAPTSSPSTPPDSSARVTPPTVATPSIPPVPAPSPAPPAPEKKAVLVLGDGTKVAVKPGVLSIGRSAESSVPLNDTNVSRRHAEIRSRSEGARIEWYLVDVGSTNGTMLNGVKISGEQKLKNGDALMFGGTAARFEVS